MGKEDEEEAAVLIEKLVNWYRFNLIYLIVLGLLFIIMIGDSDSFILKLFIIFGVGNILGLLFFRKLLCPFCHKYVLWIPDRSGGRSGKWPDGYFTPFLPKKCPHCSQSLRVKRKKKEGAEALQN